MCACISYIDPSPFLLLRHQLPDDPSLINLSDSFTSSLSAARMLVHQFMFKSHGATNTTNITNAAKITNNTTNAAENVTGEDDFANLESLFTEPGKKAIKIKFLSDQKKGRKHPQVGFLVLLHFIAITSSYIESLHIVLVYFINRFPYISNCYTQRDQLIQSLFMKPGADFNETDGFMAGNLGMFISKSLPLFFFYSIRPVFFSSPT
jgi:hypothetical protein